MEQRVGSCSICGADVVGFRGVWMSILPPPPDHCTGCGAVSRSDVIEMHPRGPRTGRVVSTTTTGNIGVNPYQNTCDMRYDS